MQVSQGFLRLFYLPLKEKSGVGIIVDKMKDYVVVIGVYYFFSNVLSLFSAKLRVSICEKCEMTS